MGTEPEPDDDNDDTIGDPKSRVDRRIATITKRRKEAEEALRQAEERIDALESELADHKKAAKAFESIQAELDSYKAKETEWADEKAMIAAGLTEEEGQDLARLAYSRIKEEDRPRGGIAEWLGDRGKLPRGVQAYLPEPESADTKTPPKTGGPKVPPNSDAKAKHAPGAPPTYQPGQISNMSTDDIQASRESIWAAMGRKPPEVNIPGVTRPKDPAK